MACPTCGCKIWTISNATKIKGYTCVSCWCKYSEDGKILAGAVVCIECKYYLRYGFRKLPLCDNCRKTHIDAIESNKDKLSPEDVEYIKGLQS